MGKRRKAKREELRRLHGLAGLRALKRPTAGVYNPEPDPDALRPHFTSDISGLGAADRRPDFDSGASPADRPMVDGDGQERSSAPGTTRRIAASHNDRPHPGRGPLAVLKRFLFSSLLIVLGASAGIAVAVARDVAEYQDRIYPGISIAGTDVGGLTRRQALTAIEAIATARLSRKITLDVDATRLPLTYAELGLRAYPNDAVELAYTLGRTGPLWQRLATRIELSRNSLDIPLRYSHDEKVVEAVLAPLVRQLNDAPQDAEVTVRNGQVVITKPSRDGRAVDVQVTLARIRAALQSGEDEVSAAISTVAPRFTTQQASDLQAPLISFTTKIAGNENRLYNIALAAGLVRGTTLAPGEVFSYNRVVGPRTVERGFKEAPVLMDDELVPGDGGGVCQVSSTLFNVALLADFEILARANHSRPVPYLPMGRDATVTYGSLDLQFRNTTGHYVLLWTRVTGLRLTMTAYGSPAPGKEVDVTVSEREEIPPPTRVVSKKDPELDEGTVVTLEAQPGYRVRTYRAVRVNGQLVRTELVGASYYRPVPRTIKVGIRKTRQARVGF